MAKRKTRRTYGVLNSPHPNKRLDVRITLSDIDAPNDSTTVAFDWSIDTEALREALSKSGVAARLAAAMDDYAAAQGIQSWSREDFIKSKKSTRRPRKHAKKG